MLESVPIRVWLLLGIAVVAAAPFRYVIEHIVHDPRRRDITQPPEDLGWRSSAQYVRSLALLAALAALAVFIFTPAAESFARSRSFWPALVSLFGAFAFGTAVLGFLNGRVRPLVRGVSTAFERATQPKRFWASLSWNALIGTACLVGGLHQATRWESDRCFDLQTGADTAKATISACSEFLAKTDDTDRRALALAQRGIGYDWLKDDRRALADYSQSLSLDPQDANTLYNRARIHERLGDPRLALADYDAFLRLRPDNGRALFNRGLILFNTGQLDKAIVDFTRAHELDPADPWPLANRGLAHVWNGDRALAVADFEKARAIDPANTVLLHGEALVALRDGKPQSAIAHLTEALRHDPNDQWALRARADAYWKLGERDKAAADDDRLNQLLDAARQARSHGT